LPFIAGAGLVAWGINGDLPIALFMGASMVATSVGITARVLSDMGQLQRRESRTILGAAVIDDVLGLLVLAMVASIAVSGEVSWSDLGVSIAAMVDFVVAFLLMGRPLMASIARRLSHPETCPANLFVALLVMLSMSALASLIGLAVIVGAFFLCLIVELG